jgi:hypothetical protein
MGINGDVIWCFLKLKLTLSVNRLHIFKMVLDYARPYSIFFSILPCNGFNRNALSVCLIKST